MSKTIRITRDDAIDAIGAIELRITDLGRWAEIWEREGEAEKALDRRTRAAELTEVIARLRGAMER